MQTRKQRMKADAVDDQTSQTQSLPVRNTSYKRASLEPGSGAQS